VSISVQDTGIGIDPKFQALIFERLYRVDSSRSNVQGYGLGLSLALAMVENLGGDLTVESTVGEGSTFTISL
jgi:signal transduction histidine kinase